MFNTITRSSYRIVNKNTIFLNKSIHIISQKPEIGIKKLINCRSVFTSKIMASNINDNKIYKNRLAKEKSPYLLQHATNPVDWYPWSNEAIEKAKHENKLIFLSVGYSTCHWCHVMEHESFENEDIAKFMNENFINIKVDREERPDIDKIYMNFLLMLNRSGGWPMSVWLTPDLAPISAGTYFPINDKWGMPGFKTVLTKIAQKWKENQNELKLTGDRVINAIQESITTKNDIKSTNNSLTCEQKLIQCIKVFKRNFDQEYGGFGDQPKFPEMPKINFLLYAYSIQKDEIVLNIVLKTLEKIGNGGIHDHIFGGFSRYSVDRKWHVPHFEKMLYDQGQLLNAYSNAYKISRNPYYYDIANSIFDYIVKDLRHFSGGFYSGEDADSLPSVSDEIKIEGAFYAWTSNEIRQLIINKENQIGINIEKAIDIYFYHYDVQENGNVEPSSDPHGHLIGKNILIVRKSTDVTCQRFGITREQLKHILCSINSILHEERDKRPRPHLDTKIISAWNGLILSGLSQLISCNTEKQNEYRKIAEQLVQFIRKYLYDEKQKILLRSCYGFKDGLAESVSQPIRGFLDDYAFVIRGLLDYYKATQDLNSLEWAKSLQDIQDSLFWDEENGGYFYSEANSPNVIVRLKEDHDGAEPCGNSISAGNLIYFSAYFEDNKYRERAEKLFNYFSDTLLFGYNLPQMMSAFILFDRGYEIITIVGPETEETKKLFNICRSFYIPDAMLFHYDPKNSNSCRLKMFEKFKMINDTPTVYICHNHVCQLPINEPSKLEEILRTNYLVN